MARNPLMAYASAAPARNPLMGGPGPYEARQSDRSALAQSMAADVDPLNAALADYWRGLSGQGQGSGWFGMNTVPQELNRLAAFNREAAGTENPLTGPEGMAAMRALFDSPLAPGFGAIGTVGGVGARTADLVALARAQDMAAAGEDAAKIVRETGWWTGPDGKWRFEIDDSQAMARMPVSGIEARQDQYRVTAPMAYRHDDLYAAYPELMSTGIRSERGNPGAYFEPENNIVGIVGPKPDKYDMPRADVVGHELQHNVQKLEDFARGGSMAQFSEAPARRLELEYGWSKAAVDKLKSAIDEGADQALIRDPSRNGAYTMIQGRDEMARLYDELSSRLGQLDAEYKAADPFEQYRRLYGEVEARAVQARMNMTPEERRLRPFWLDADVPQDQWIVRGQDGGVSMSTDDVAQGAARLADDLPRLFYRGTNPGDTRRIRTGADTWDSYLFASSVEDEARMYGSSIERIMAKPDAKILYEGTRDWVRVVGKWRKNESMLDYADRAARAAREAGYDAAHFKMQGNVGTAIFNESAFIRNYGNEAEAGQ